MAEPAHAPPERPVPWWDRPNCPPDEPVFSVHATPEAEQCGMDYLVAFVLLVVVLAIGALAGAVAALLVR